MKWFTLPWYQYLFDFSYEWCGYTNFSDKVRILICRIKGHPNGPVWYCHGLEPDMHCKDCGEEL